METLFCPACGAANNPEQPACCGCGASLDTARHQLQEARAHYQRALSFLEEEAIDDAVLALEAALERSPRTPAFHNLLGTVYARRGLYDLALAQWRNALLAHPDQAEAWRNIEQAQQLEERRYLQRIQRRPWRMVVGLLSVLLVVALAAAIMMSRQALALRTQLAGLRGQPEGPAASSAQERVQRDLDEARNALLLKDRELDKLRRESQQLQENWTLELAGKQEQIKSLASELDTLQRRSLASVDPNTATGVAQMRELGVEPGARVPLAASPGGPADMPASAMGLAGPGEQSPPPPADLSDCDAMLAQARTAMEQGNLARAEELINACLNLDARNNQARQLFREIARRRD